MKQFFPDSIYCKAANVMPCEYSFFSVSAAATSNSGRGGRYPSRGGFRSESFRGRGNFSGGRGYGRNDFRSPGEFSGKPRGGGGRGAEGYQRVDQNGTGNPGRQGAQK